MLRRAVAIGMFVASVLSSASAEAQARRTYWGVEATFAPEWRVPDWQEFTFDAEAVDLAGSEFRIGFVRGQALGGDWGLSFVGRGIKDAAAAVLGNDGDVTTTNGNSLQGVEIHRFSPFTTIKDRVQIGLSYGIGAGWFKETVAVRHPDGQVEQMEAKAIFSPADINFPVVPIGRMELAVAFIAGPNFKFKASGGVNFPGQQTISISAIYLFAPR